jgi:hypothetical protein
MSNTLISANEIFELKNRADRLIALRNVLKNQEVPNNRLDQRYLSELSKIYKRLNFLKNELKGKT